MPTPVTFDPAIGRQLLKYARLLAARGYVHNAPGNIVLRAPHPDYPHGVAYTKHAELSLEEMGLENIVVTDIPTSRVLYGAKTTSVGHNLSREILPTAARPRSRACTASPRRSSTRGAPSG